MSDASTNPRINTTLREARERAGISLSDAAEHLGITNASMSRMETGVSGVTADRLDALAKLYGVTIGGLFDGRLVTMPTTIDIDRMRAVVLLVQEVIQKRRLKPSPEKVADAVAMVFRREIEWLIQHPEADLEFDPKRHVELVETVFRK